MCIVNFFYTNFESLQNNIFNIFYVKKINNRNWLIYLYFFYSVQGLLSINGCHVDQQIQNGHIQQQQDSQFIQIQPVNNFNENDNNNQDDIKNNSSDLLAKLLNATKSDELDLYKQKKSPLKFTKALKRPGRISSVCNFF